MKTTDFEVNNVSKHHLPNLPELVKILEQKTDSPETLILTVTLNSKYEECADLCKSRSRKIKDINQIEHDFFETIQPGNNFSSTESPVSEEKYISDQFCSVDITKWNYFFFTDKEYLFVRDNFTRFFTKKSYDQTRKSLLKSGCKGQLCSVLHDIYYHFCSGPLKNDRHFLNLAKNLSPFSKQNLSQIYSNIQRYRYLISLSFLNFFDFFEAMYITEI